MSEPQEGYSPSGGEQVWPAQPVPPVQGTAQGQWSYGGPYGPPPGVNPYLKPPPPPRRWRAPVITATVVAVVAATAGVTVGHVVWHTGTSAASSSAGGQGSGSGVNPFGLPNGNGNSNSGSGGSSGSGSSGSGSTSEGSGGPSDVSAIAQKVDPALVDINSTFSYQSAEGAGTGIVLTSNGEILTNNHVINGATSISVTDVGNGKTYSAVVVGYDASQDIAVLQLQGASGLTTANIGDSSTVSVGQAVVAIGNAGGTGGTPSSAGGSVTAVNQSITASDELDGTSEKLSGLLEVNADVQSGDSGGSLVNASGQVIGMDTAASQSYSFESQGQGGGDGFAIPINTAISIAKQIEAGQSSSTIHVGETAFLGVLVQTSTGSTGQGGSLGFGAGSSSTSGAQVSQVVQNSGAAQAGLTAGDTITSLNGQTVTSAADLTSIVATLKAGQTVPITYTDTNNQSHTSTITPTSGPPA